MTDKHTNDQNYTRNKSNEQSLEVLMKSILSNNRESIAGHLNSEILRKKYVWKMYKYIQTLCIVEEGKNN